MSIMHIAQHPIHEYLRECKYTHSQGMFCQMSTNIICVHSEVESLHIECSLRVWVVNASGMNKSI